MTILYGIYLRNAKWALAVTALQLPWIPVSKVYTTKTNVIFTAQVSFRYLNLGPFVIRTSNNAAIYRIYHQSPSAGSMVINGSEIADRLANAGRKWLRLLFVFFEKSSPQLHNFHYQLPIQFNQNKIFKSEIKTNWNIRVKVANQQIYFLSILFAVATH